MYADEHRSRDHYQGRARWYDWANRFAAAVQGVSQKKERLKAMARVGRPGGKVVICDAGVPSDGRPPFKSRLLLRLQPMYDKPPPMDLIPSGAKDVRLTWIRGGA